MKDAYATTTHKRTSLQRRRDDLRAAKLCINGPREGNVGSRGTVHGPAEPGMAGRCRRCWDVKKGRTPS